MDEKDLKNLSVPVAILVLAILAFFLIRPIFAPIILGLIFAYIFYTTYLRFFKHLKSKNWSAFLIVALCLCVFVLPFLIAVFASTSQILSIYIQLKNLDIGALIGNLIPSFFNNPAIAGEVTATLSHLSAQLSTLVLSFFNNTVLALPAIIMGIIILLFTFFFALVEGENVRNYIATIFPFPKEYFEKFYTKFDQVTNSFIYGNLVVGLAQGIIAGVGYFLLGVPNAFLLTLLTTLASLLPVIGPSLIWVPATVYLFLSGDNVAGISLLIYGLFVINWVHTFLVPRIISSKAEMNPAIALIGVIGGLYAFGFIGLILGPLVLAYLILLIEIYKDKKVDSIILKEEQPVKT